MELVVRLSQKAYGICIVAMGIQQLAYGDIDPNFLPRDFSTSPVYEALVYPWGVAFTLSGMALLINKKALEVALVLGVVFLSLFLLIHLPYNLFLNEDKVFMWAPAMGDIAFSGSSFALAASLRSNPKTFQSDSLFATLEKLIPFAGVFFSIMLIVFGIDHFLYTELVAGLIPSWISNQFFWTYFTGTALIAAGVAIILRIKVRIVASLLGAMIFLWFLFLHIPRAFSDPLANRGIELTRVFVTLGYSSTAFLFAFASCPGWQWLNSKVDRES